MTDDRLTLFDPLVSQWFHRRYGTPTNIQNLSWQAISGGEHILMTAPTGSGKTMAAFLWAINELIQGRWSTGHTRVLYVSPLKALNNDIQRNLLTPLDQLRTLYKENKQPFPDIRQVIFPLLKAMIGKP